MKNTPKLFITSIFLVMLSACVQVVEEPKSSHSQVAISSVRDMPIIYPLGSTFFLSPKYLEDVSLKPEEQRNIYQLYNNALIENLQSNGYKMAATAEQADFHVGFAIALGEDLSDDVISEKFGVTPGLQGQDTLEKGSFLIYVEDVATTQRVWRGAVQGFVQESLSDHDRETRVKGIVSMVIVQFYNAK